MNHIVNVPPGWTTMGSEAVARFTSAAQAWASCAMSGQVL
jgi:hypothetical protein